MYNVHMYFVKMTPIAKKVKTVSRYIFKKINLLTLLLYVRTSSIVVKLIAMKALILDFVKKLVKQKNNSLS